ncbi:hypothetical protein [Anaerocolumna sp.]|uniref:hypothetical protein n=1 Tax=Anaerocolumna sp. TaxID=2041569 RepID=UPI0028B01B13|nr:hypothetical protein [Anaerocolumna sp.]
MVSNSIPLSCRTQYDSSGFRDAGGIKYILLHLLYFDGFGAAGFSMCPKPIFLIHEEHR